MRKFLLVVLLAALAGNNPIMANPDEGMWLPLFIKRLNAEEIAKSGCKLTPEEIYSINNSSLKDAIVWLEFCTAEIVSDNGLMLTNHHCAYGGIQSNSTEQNNYLDNGFWAKSFSEELPVKGQTASVLLRMEDVTAKVLAEVKPNSTPEERAAAVKKATTAIQEEASEKGAYRALVRDMFNGNEYYLFVYETFKDIRLVGAPPQNIGKFGGDTDNWMWPRHTGDFSFMRIYMGKDGKPANYSADNVPYKPRHVLPVSLKGYKEGDYAMILGFPGRTNRYAVSESLRLIMEKSNPVQIKLNGKKLETWKKNMEANTAVRIQYSSKYASTANGWKYAIGQNEGLKRLNVIANKKKTESEFQKWADADAERSKKYGSILSDYDKAIKSYEAIIPQQLYLALAGKASEALRMVTAMEPLVNLMEKTPEKTSAIDSLKNKILSAQEKFFNDYHPATDHEVAYELFLLYLKDIPADQLPPMLAAVHNGKGKNLEEKVKKFTDDLFAKSIFASVESMKAFLQNPSVKKFRKDKLVMLNADFNAYQTKVISPVSGAYLEKTDLLKRNFLEAYKEFKKDSKLYPDANGTLRMTYGNVKAYEPKDAVSFDYYTTSDGILEKYIPKDDEFDMPAKLIDLLNKKDFGKYAENGELHVAFLTTNDITGGNSGSPVINDKGELIGVAFDGNWEAMTGDLVFDPELKRTICVDIRYVLFIMDQYAGAQNLINELKIKN
jgi:hypothetical protein